MNDFEISGWRVVPRWLSELQIDALGAPLRAANNANPRARHGELFALRDALRVPEVANLCRAPELRAPVAGILGDAAFVVRAILFDKTASANWKVPFHQDLTIAVRDQREAPGFGPWSRKDGVPHVQPPRDVLERMLTVRLHLDDCDARNGPLRVLSGSHAGGKLSAPEIAAWRERAEEAEVHVPRGGALLMRPLLLHASSISREPHLPRRVLHLEWAAHPLPCGLQWRDAL